MLGGTDGDHDDDMEMVRIVEEVSDIVSILLNLGPTSDVRFSPVHW